MLQQLVGADGEGDVKTYRLFPPILFPEGSTRMRDVFLNPALINVSDPLSLKDLVSRILISRRF
jgi:hypothetical protein